MSAPMRSTGLRSDGEQRQLQLCAGGGQRDRAEHHAGDADLYGGLGEPELRHGDPEPLRDGERVCARADAGDGDHRDAELRHGGDAVEQCRLLCDQRGSGLTANNGNYSFVQAAGNATALSITPATLTYTADLVSQSYGTAIPSLSGTVSGFVLGQTQATATTGTLSFGTAATQSSNVGSYAINGSGLTANNGNYSFVQAAGNATALSITPATLTYTADLVSQSYGTAIPSLSGTVSGFVLWHMQATATTETLSFGTAATQSSNVGSYAIK